MRKEYTIGTLRALFSEYEGSPEKIKAVR